MGALLYYVMTHNEGWANCGGPLFGEARAVENWMRNKYNLAAQYYDAVKNTMVDTPPWSDEKVATLKRDYPHWAAE